MNPSCIKIPVPRNFSSHSIFCKRETDIRDQICTKNDLITIANEVFGYGKWSHAVTSQTIDFVEYITGRYHTGCAAFVKIQLTDGTFHEDMGYSNSDGSTKGLAILSARTGSITNAMKNTLLHFGGEIATKMNHLVKVKIEESNAILSAIAEPLGIIIPKQRLAPPQAQSTPQKIPSTSICVASTTVETNNRVDSNEGNPRSPMCLQSVENEAQADKPALMEEERRLERKRRQAQKQDEYRKLLKEKESVEKPNPRF